MPEKMIFDPLYPDVLGAVTGGARIPMESLQIAVGVFPRQSYINQPFEVIIILQNRLDVPLSVRVAISLPTRNGDAPMNIVAPNKTMDWIMQAGEVGVLRMPLIPMPPTPAGTDYPVRVAVRARPQGTGKVVRPPAGGAPPSVLAVSPFKLQVLRDVEYAHHPNQQSPESVMVHFDIAARRMPPPTVALKPSYEVLWKREQMEEERQGIVAKIDEARMLATTFSRIGLFAALRHAVGERFAANGLPLHPGEEKCIAKMLTYTLVDAQNAGDPNYKLEDTRWFQALCGALAYNPALVEWEQGELVARYLLDSLFYDAVLTAFTLIRPRVLTNLGDRAERVNYANRLLTWLAGQGEPDLTYIYLPLALGGLAVNVIVTGRGDDPWQLLDEARDAYRGRVRLASGGAVEIFDMLDKLLERAEDDLRRARIQRE